MSIKPKTCKISQGATLKDVAIFLDVTPEHLKRYHNIYCPLEDLIGVEIPSHVRVLYVPPKDRALRDEIFNSNSNSINYKSEGKLKTGNYSKKYGVVQETFVGDKLKSTIHYVMDISNVKNCIKLTREKLYINNTRPDLFIYEIGEQINEILYPLKFGLNEDGTIDNVTNIDEIQNRWEFKKPELKKYYKGDVVDKLLKNVDSRIAKPYKVTNSIKTSIFYKLFFIPLYGMFDKHKKQDFIIYIQLDKILVPFNMNMVIKPESLKNGKFSIEVKGTSKEFDDIYLNMIYKMNSKINTIFGIRGEIKLRSAKKIIFNCHEIKIIL